MLAENQFGFNLMLHNVGLVNALASATATMALVGVGAGALAGSLNHCTLAALLILRRLQENVVLQLSTAATRKALRTEGGGANAARVALAVAAVVTRWAPARPFQCVQTCRIQLRAVRLEWWQ
jgi:hypothetical protein